MVTSWQYTCESIKESIRTLRELIDVRDGYSECIGFTSDEIDEFILSLYICVLVNHSFYYYINMFYTLLYFIYVPLSCRLLY